MLTIFLSHVNDDEEIALALGRELESLGYSTWCYERDSLPGHSYLETTHDAIVRCEVFLILISLHSLASRQVQVELERAHESSRKIIPILYGLNDAEYKRKNPFWKQIIGTSVSCPVTPSTVKEVAGKIARGLAQASSVSTFPVPPTPAQTVELRVPAGFRAASGTAAEPYAKSGWAQEIVHAGTGMLFRFIPPGVFTMGSPATETGRSSDEVQHRVTLPQGFYLGKYQVTQAQWEKVMGFNPSTFKGADLPVETVSWDDCHAFLGKLGPGARLPTEAEWEYACRAGTTGALAGELEQMAWYYANSGGKTHPVGQKLPNAWGLYDMHGNVWEWCSDWYGAYPAGAVTGPQGAQTGSGRVIRGGSLLFGASNCRSADRYYFDPSSRTYHLGLRVVFAPPGQ